MATEDYIGQTVLYLPPGIKRIAWRLGLKVAGGVGGVDGSDGSVTTSAITLYAASIPYVGGIVGGGIAFDVAALPAGYAKDVVAVVATSSLSRGVFGALARVDRSAAGIAPMPVIADDRFDRWVHLILTVTSETTGTSPRIRIYDCCIWGEKV